MGGLVDSLFGSEPTQYGEATTAGQSWLQQLLKPGIQSLFSNYQSGQPGFNVPQAPQAPGVPNYNVTPYSTPQAPFGSPSDMIQGGEMNAARNLMEQLYSGGGGGSAMGGLSGQGAQVMGNVLSDLSQGAVGRYAQMQLPYAQMQAQQAQDVWNMQNQVWNMPLQQANLGYTQGQIPQWQAQAQAMDPRWLYQMYSGTYGSPMVGSKGVFERFGEDIGNIF